ncbi:MAG TPA: hypothetical protein VHP58_03020 [Alphaproteobacteria bacterium]|nr:hypothetical protein [Alphaproteobacteria bacterium]
MNVEQVAELYVHVIEPALKVLAFFIIVITVLYLFNALADSKKKTEFVNNTFNFILKAVFLIFTGVGRAAIIVGRLLLRIINLLIATISDFFTSKI